MSGVPDNVNNEIPEIIARIRRLAPWLAKIQSSPPSDQDAEFRSCSLSLRNDRSQAFGANNCNAMALPNGKYLFVDNVRSALAAALERTDVQADRKLDALRCAIDFADAFEEIEFDSWGTCSQDDAYRLAMSAFSIAMATGRPPE
jgi:hypothetical protein